MTRGILAGLFLAALGTAGSATAAPPLRLAGSAELVPASPGGASRGAVRLASDPRFGARERVRVVATLGGLDATREANGDLPEFRMVLTPPGVGDPADLGALAVNARGEARLRLGDASRALGGRSLRSFVGGTIDVLREGTRVLSAPVPELSLEGAGTSSSLRRVFGPLLPQVAGEAPGDWLAVSLRDGSGVHADRVAVVAEHVDTLPNAAGQAPVHRVFVLNRDLTRVASFGTMVPEQTYGAALHADQSKGTFPAGIATIEEFAEGRVEVRLANNATILRGFMPPFPSIGDRPTPGRSASSRGTEELAPPEGGDARALAGARRTLHPARVSETFSLRAAGLDPAAGPYTVVATAAGGTRTTLGTLRTDAAGNGRLSLSTARGGVPGGLPWLSGQTLDVRDANGAVVVAGSFPTIE